MGGIITLDQEKDRRIMGEINAILAKYGKAMSPKVTMALAGIKFEIDLVDVKQPAGGGGNSHA